MSGSVIEKRVDKTQEKYKSGYGPIQTDTDRLNSTQSISIDNLTENFQPTNQTSGEDIDSFSIQDKFNSASNGSLANKNQQENREGQNTIKRIVFSEKCSEAINGYSEHNVRKTPNRFSSMKQQPQKNHCINLLVNQNQNLSIQLGRVIQQLRNVKLQLRNCKQEKKTLGQRINQIQKLLNSKMDQIKKLQSKISEYQSFEQKRMPKIVDNQIKNIKKIELQNQKQQSQQECHKKRYLQNQANERFDKNNKQLDLNQNQIKNQNKGTVANQESIKEGHNDWKKITNQQNVQKVNFDDKITTIDFSILQYNIETNQKQIRVPHQNQIKNSQSDIEQENRISPQHYKQIQKDKAKSQQSNQNIKYDCFSFAKKYLSKFSPTESVALKDPNPYLQDLFLNDRQQLKKRYFPIKYDNINSKQAYGLKLNNCTQIRIEDFWKNDWRNITDLSLIKCSINDQKWNQICEKSSEFLPRLLNLIVAGNQSLTNVTQRQLRNFKGIKAIYFSVKKLKMQNVAQCPLSQKSKKQIQKYKNKHSKVDIQYLDNQN